MERPILLGAPRDLYVRPLIHSLISGKPFTVAPAAGSMNAVKLRNHEVTAALVSPIDYARDGSEYFIVPDIAVSSTASTGMAAIHFREGVQSMSTLAADPSWSMEIILARIILAESFDITPSIVPVSGSIDDMLRKADAALVVGDQALRADVTSTHSLDLIEEWLELTELPFVHALWCGRENALDDAKVRVLREARDSGLNLTGEICSAGDIREAFPRFSPADLENYLGGFTYELSEETETALKEIFKFAYYHGILPDVPDLRYFGETESDDPTRN